MMGTKERSFAPLIHVSLEELVPHDHFYRHLERTLDLSFVREFVQETYAGGGRPSIGANLSLRSREGAQERRTQEALLDPRQEAEPLVDASTRTGTEKAPQTWQTQLHPCRTPLSQDYRTPAAQATGGQQPHADETSPFVCFLFSTLSHRLFRLVLGLPLLQQRQVGLYQALLPLLGHHGHAPQERLPFLFLQHPSHQRR